MRALPFFQLNIWQFILLQSAEQWCGHWPSSHRWCCPLEEAGTSQSERTSCFLLGVSAESGGSGGFIVGESNIMFTPRLCLLCLFVHDEATTPSLSCHWPSQRLVFVCSFSFGHHCSLMPCRWCHVCYSLSNDSAIPVSYSDGYACYAITHFTLTYWEAVMCMLQLVKIIILKYTVQHQGKGAILKGTVR